MPAVTSPAPEAFNEHQHATIILYGNAQLVEYKPPSQPGCDSLTTLSFISMPFNARSVSMPPLWVALLVEGTLRNLVVIL